MMMNRKTAKLARDAARLIHDWPDLASRWHEHVASGSFRNAENDVLRFGRRYHSLQVRAARLAGASL